MSAELPAWLDWARRLQALAQTGLTYAQNEFERERWERALVLAAEMAAAGSLGEAEALAAAFALEAGYATPKVDVRGVCFRDGKLLLVRGSDDRLWTPPGGFAEVGETPREAVEKEVLEESGYRSQAVRLLGVRDRRSTTSAFHVWKHFFLCELEETEPAEPMAHEISEVAFFGEDELPALSRRAGGELGWLFEHAREETLPPLFD
jgi:ADP-ribose pyrophosphatase YjhB (NUDIX family)